MWFFWEQIHCGLVWKVVRVTMMNSGRSLETRLEVFPVTLASFTHPVYTQKWLFGILGIVPHCDSISRSGHKKNIWFESLKKTLLSPETDAEKPPFGPISAVNKGGAFRGWQQNPQEISKKIAPAARKCDVIFKYNSLIYVDYTSKFACGAEIDVISPNWRHI